MSMSDLGDINCNNKVDTTDIFYLMQMVAEAKDNKISTVELDAELKNKNSSWYKNYSIFEVCSSCRCYTRWMD